MRGFGKIENYDITLSNGLNVIYGPNESGKSTLMAFIKAMLYGLKGGRTSKEGIVSEAKRYTPWSKASYGGYINFELDNGSSYRIDRAFENGIVKLFDESFNEITSNYTDGKYGSGIAERLIGLNESLFERTVYIKQMGTRIDNSSSKDLIDRISNIRQSGSEEVSYNKANAALKEALKQQVGTDRSYTRPLDLINKRLSELNTAKIRIQDENKNLIEAHIKQEELTLQIGKLSEKEMLFSRLQEFCELKEKLKLQLEKKEEFLFLNERIKQSQKDIHNLDKDKISLEQEIANNSEQIVMLEKQNSFVGQEAFSEHKVVKPFQEEEPKQNDSKSKAKAIQDEIKKQKTWIKASNICIILSLILVIGVSCGVFVFKAISAWLITMPVLILIAVVSLKFKCGSRFKQLLDQQSEIYEKSKKLNNEISNAHKINQILKQQLVSLDERTANEKTRYEQLIKRLESQSANFKQDDIVNLENEIDRVSEMILGIRETVDNELTQTEKELFEGILENNSDSKYLEIIELRKFLTSELQQKKLEYATAEAKIKQNVSIQKDELFEDEILRLTQKKECLEQRGEALSIAIKTLEEATNELQKKYIPIMNKVFEETFSGLTAEKYSDIRAGENLNIMLSDPKSETIVPVSMLSNGTIDQMYLALRIAIAETVLKINEGLPFIMDEPFAQYDDERTDNALRYIYNISKKQQVIIFTCKQREVDLISSQFPCKICSLT